jgi:very-short-patch-repair endonuclease
VSELPGGLHGVYRRTDLIDRLGLPAVRELLSDGRLASYSRNVLVERGRMFALPTRAAAALYFVGPRSALASHTAALVFGCTAADAAAIHVLAAHDRRLAPRQGLEVHRGEFDEDEVLTLDGLRTLGLETVIADMLCTVRRPVALSCADQALAALDPPYRGGFRAEVAKRLRARADLRGVRRGEVLLALATGLPESPAESQLLLALYDARLPIPRLQHSVRDVAGRERYRIDFAWEEPRIALEYDGREAHEHRCFEDAAREADLRSRGWTVFRATAADLRDPARLVHGLRAAFAGWRSVA